jgi:hypothetical protein
MAKIAAGRPHRVRTPSTSPPGNSLEYAGDGWFPQLLDGPCWLRVRVGGTADPEDLATELAAGVALTNLNAACRRLRAALLAPLAESVEARRTSR